MSTLLRYISVSLSLLTGLFVLLPGASAQTFSVDFKPFKEAPAHYVCYRTDAPVAVNGKPDEAAWGRAPWTADFLDIEGAAKPKPLFQTRVKMLWDEQHLYIFAELKEPHIWATLRQHDTIIFHNNDFEVFIDPDGDSHQYYEIEINALNTVMDLFMVKPYRNGSTAMLNWDTKGLRTAVQINGTLNNPADRDVSWTVEMAIPFKSLGNYQQRIVPAEETTWRVNFSRVQWQSDIAGGQYVKKPKTPEYNWVWSPQGIINMHAPERWGYLQFTRNTPGNTVAFKQPAYTAARAVLWEVYYRQQQYRRANKKYAADLGAIGMQPGALVPVLEATGSQFTAQVRDKGFISVINQEGKINSYHE